METAATESMEPTASAPEEAATAVQEALEAMLSKHNLARDQFLAGYMNPQMYIPIQVLLAHERLQNVGATEALVVEVARRSARLGVDENGTMVRPLLKSKRNVVILRDIPPDTTEAEMREFLAGAPHADKIVSVKPEVNNTWFVKFKLDDGVPDVVLWLRSQRFRGQPVNAAIKSEHFLRSFFPLPLAGPGAAWPAGGPPAEGPEQWQPPGPPGPPPGPGLAWPGPQPPGFWRPWGARHQPPPLVFVSATELAPESAPAVAQQAAAIGPEVLDNLKGGARPRRGDRGEDRGAAPEARGRGRGEGDRGRGARWVPRHPGPDAACGPGAAYSHEFRRHARERFEEVSKAMRGEQLVMPEALRLLGNDVPVVLEVPSVVLA